MTRFLSESLQAVEPQFRLKLMELEKMNGHPNADIRLSNNVLLASHAKLAELGLDPKDTTAVELYNALQSRIKRDDTNLVRTLQTLAATHVSAEADVVAGMAHALRGTAVAGSCFALKASKAKLLLKKSTPKKVMKLFGYRSLDSMIRHEPIAQIIAAVSLLESASWQKTYFDQYKKLKPADFEIRPVTILHPSNVKWRQLANTTVATSKHNILTLRELGTLVLLPLPVDAPSGVVTASLILALQALNDIKAGSSYLKLAQMRSDFGSIAYGLVTKQASPSTTVLDQPISWHLIQRSFERFRDGIRHELFEPHVESADLTWHGIEEALSAIDPRLSFWHHGEHLAVLHDRKPVSLNIVDAALNLCNHLPFERRISQYFRQALWHELLLSYLQPHTIEQGLLHALQPQLAFETAIS